MTKQLKPFYIEVDSLTKLQVVEVIDKAVLSGASLYEGVVGYHDAVNNYIWDIFAYVGVDKNLNTVFKDKKSIYGSTAISISFKDLDKYLGLEVKPRTVLCLTDSQKTEAHHMVRKLGYNKTAVAKHFGVSTRTIGRVLEEESFRRKLKTEKSPVAETVGGFIAGDLLTEKEEFDEYIITKHDTIVMVTEDKPLDSNDIYVKVISTTDSLDEKSIGRVFAVKHKHFKKVGHISQSKEVPETVPETTVEDVKVAYTMTPLSTALSFDGVSRVVNMTHPHFKEINKLILDNKVKEALDLMDIGQSITKWCEGKLSIEDGEISFDGLPIQNGLVDKILLLMKEGEKSFERFAKFLKLTLENPSFKTRQRLMEFASADDIDIYEDGRLIGFKNTREDGYAKHKGKWVKENGKWSHNSSQRYFNGVGEILEMPRNEVNDDDDVTCSHGLHLCSILYLDGFWGTSGKNFKALVSPADIISIPTDYQNSKLRCCKYEVLKELSHNEVQGELEKFRSK